MNEWHAQVTIDLPGRFTLDDIDALVDKVRETAGPFLSADGRRLTVQWTAATKWDLRGEVMGTLYEIESNFSGYSRDLDAEALIEKVTRFQGEARPFA